MEATTEGERGLEEGNVASMEYGRRVILPVRVGACVPSIKDDRNDSLTSAVFY